jgi:hypothetical protein
MKQLRVVMSLLKTEHSRLTKEIEGISAALSAFGASYGRGAGRRKISAEGRARIAEAQRQRWARVKGKSGPTKSGTPANKKRTMSASARKKIAAAQRLRWEKVKAAQKKAA